MQTNSHLDTRPWIIVTLTQLHLASSPFNFSCEYHFVNHFFFLAAKKCIMSVFIAIYYVTFQYSVFCDLKFSGTWHTVLNKAPIVCGEIFLPSVILQWCTSILIYGTMLTVSQIFEFVSRYSASCFDFTLFYYVTWLKGLSDFLHMQYMGEKKRPVITALHFPCQMVKFECETNCIYS